MGFGPTTSTKTLLPRAPGLPAPLAAAPSTAMDRCESTATARSARSDRFSVQSQRRQSTLVNLPGWCWAEIQQFALVGSSSSLHSEACNALGASDGVIHSRISQEVVCLRATTNETSPCNCERLLLQFWRAVPGANAACLGARCPQRRHSPSDCTCTRSLLK